MEHRVQSSEAASRLGCFLRENRSDILATWEARVRQLAPAKRLSRPALLDHIPQLLDQIAELVERLSRGEPSSLPQEDAEQHAQDRLELGFDLEEVVLEYAALRDGVLEMWQERTDAPLEPSAVRLLNRAIDQGIASSVTRFVASRNRTVEALDRISTAALETRSLDEFLQKLLEAFLESSVAVDTVAVLIRDAGGLTLRAAAGLDSQAAQRGLHVPLDRSFAGQVVRERRPLSLRSPDDAEAIAGLFLPHDDMRAVHAVPLMDAGRVIGVAEMGSTTADAFSDQDERLFRGMVRRATAALIQHALRDEARALAEILELGDPFFLLDRDWRLVRVNRSLERLTGAVQDQLIGRVLWDVWPVTAEPDRRYRAELERVMAERVAVEFDEQFDAPDRWVSITAYPTHGGAAAVFLRDASERKRLEAARERFVAVVGHDLRNPLQAIMSTAGALLLRNNLPGPLASGLARIASAADRMSSMLSDVIDWTRRQLGGVIPLEPRPVRLEEICARVIAEARAAHPDRDIQLEVTGEAAGRWDPDRMAQVVSNLIGNALQHGAADRPVRVLVGPVASGEVVLEVCNEGQAIPPHLVPHLFEPFERLAPAGEPSRSGSLGLGLYIVDQIVKAHGGRIEVESAASATGFRAILPAGG